MRTKLKRLLSLLLCLVLVLNSVPLSVFAADESGEAANDVTDGYYDKSGTWVAGGNGTITYEGVNGGNDLVLSKTAEITDINELPDEVVDASRLRGSSVLDEYLRYRRREEIKTLREMQNMTDAARSSMGAQSNHAAPDNPERNLFIKALWGN